MVIGKFKFFLSESLNKTIKLFLGMPYFQSRIVRRLVFFSALVNLIDWLALRFFLRSGENFIILHYNVYFGVDWRGLPKEAFFLPFIGLILLAINFLTAFYFYARKERIAAYLILMTALMAQLILLISIISVIIINY